MPSDSRELDAAGLFAGAGEVAALMRAFDWAGTAAGRPEQWPQSLLTPVRIVLNSRFAMWMGWGKELTFFYNDAYASILGAKHPWALGRPVREVWAEIWPQIAPRIEKVLGTGTATWDERLQLFLERSGYSEETYHTFSYSPLADERGVPSGMLCVVSEETERVIGERRLALLHELAAQIATAHSTRDVLSAVQVSLGKESRDLPFTLTHVLGDEGEAAERVALTGMAPEHPAAADQTQAGPSTRLWPIARVLEHRSWEVVELSPELDWPGGPWDQPPTHAVVLPIPRQGQLEPTGVFIAGLNRFRPFDEDYRNFLGLFVGQLAAGLASARAHAAERRRAEALADLDRAKTTFFSNISHEFRTPLTLMLGPTEDALSSSRVLAGTELESVHRNQLRLLKLVNTLLDFSRIEAGRVTVEYQALDLGRLTTDLASTFRSAIERAGLRLVVQVEPLPESVFADPQMWERILLNLLSNAFKFTFEGAITVRLHAPEAGWVRLSVTDTGVGIAEHELGRVFERFRRIEGTRARTHEGSGIGLALVSDLVKLHGGRIALASREHQGTTFTVDIPTGSAHVPLAQRVTTRLQGVHMSAAPFVTEALRWLHDDNAAPGQGEDVSDEGLPPPSYQERRSHILVVDDNADMRAYLTRILRQRWSVEAVGDGREALRACSARRPDLIVTDVMMPELDGMALLSRIKSDPALRGIPVVMLSARAGEEARIEGIQAGADEYLVKPFSARELLARIGTRLELQRLGRRLAHERAAISDLFERTPMPVAILKGEELIFESANVQYINVMGGRSLVGKPLLQALPELRGQGWDELLRGVLRSGVAHVGREARVRILRGGALVDTYWTFIYAPVRAENGRVDSVIALCNEVTEQVEARQRVEGLALEAARANRTKDEFLAMLGHELRNPLAPMVTALQLMRLRGTESREQDVLERQVAHLSRLVDDLLDVSRITRGKIELHRRPAELSEVVLRAMEMASPVLEETQHRVEIQVDPIGLGVKVDVDRMAQVVSNLLTNAAKYSDARSRIVIRGAAAGERVRLSIKDEGIGIASEMLDEVFDAFMQQPQTIERSRGGLGLGLTIVRSLVEKHDGVVRAESAGVGQGSEFIVELPPAPVESNAPASVPAIRLTPRAGAQRAQRILIVDDNQDAAELLGEALQSMGHVVTVAHDGPSALRASLSFQPEVALLDIGLPVMDGYELAQRLLELHATGDSDRPLKLIAITGYGQDSDRERSARAGFEQHLVKPLDLNQLERAIEAAESQVRSAE
jgi:signal transduction histidine kinase/DNA-binding response OmpR family regulator